VSRAWTTFALWGVFLAVLTAVTTPFGADVYTWGQLAISAAFILALALVVFAYGRRAERVPGQRVRTRTDLSYPSMLLGVGLAALALGAELGLWLVLIGAGACVLAVGGLVREWRAERHAAEEL